MINFAIGYILGIAVGIFATVYLVRGQTMEESNLKIKVVELSKWSCNLFGGQDNNGVCWRPQKGQEPNVFWRWMQFICFGNRWVKDK